MGDRLERAVVDTSVVIDRDRIDPAELPEKIAASAITRNPDDFPGLDGLVDVHPVEAYGETG